MEELKSPRAPCPSSVPVRRNPPRRAKTPAAAAATTLNTTTPSSSKSAAAAKRKGISAFPLQEILECQLPTPTPTTTTNSSSQNLRVFLRIKPLITNSIKSTSTSTRKAANEATSRSTLPIKKKKSTKKIETQTQTESEACLVVNDAQSVTLTPPQSMQDSKRLKSEVYDGFTHVFNTDSTQNQVYEKVMEPLVMDFLKGKSGMITAMGPTGSGKTHTIFGSPRQPGILSLAFANLFGEHSSSSSYYMSMFEINSERKGERLIDLLSSDGPDLSLQQSAIKGLQEETISSVVEAELMIARGMLRRSTAMTNSNSQSSRSQCIINIRGAPEVIDGEVDGMPNNAVLTIVDLAGAEREKKTGNQGTRLMESNFINTTSMVFGLCLRSLLEHQKNPKKPLQKHFQNSLLTKYLRDYLEGKKRMALILTVKSGGDDYLDASFLLRQASPYMKIKFNIVEEPSQKRNLNKLPREEKSKRRKLSDPDAYKIDEGDSSRDAYPAVERDTELISVLPQQLETASESVSPSISVKGEMNESARLEEYCVELERMKRNEQVMQKFSKALWNVLKQYKQKLEDSENEVQVLQKSLKEENSRIVELEKQMEELKSCSLNIRKHSTEPSSCVQLAGDSRSPDLKDSVSNLGSTDATTEHCPEILPQSESSSTAMECSNLLIKDLKRNGNQTYESSTVNGSGVKCIHGKDVEVKEDLTGADRADLIASSSIEQVMVGDTSCSPKAQDTILSELAFPGSQELRKEEAGSVDSCNGNVRNSDSEHSLPFNSSIVEKPRILLSEPSKLLVEITDSNLEVSKGKPKVSPHDAVEYVDTCSASEMDSENVSPCKSLNEKKPRRRLLPASSILLREINNLGLEDENERPTGSRGWRKVAAEGIKRTQGSISLLKLLNNLNI